MTSKLIDQAQNNSTNFITNSSQKQPQHLPNE